MLHLIWQRQGMLPSRVLQLPKGERAFLFASALVWMEEQSHLPEKE